VQRSERISREHSNRRMYNAGEYLKVLATISKDNDCDVCPSGTFQSASDHIHRSCTDWDDCAASTYSLRHALWYTH
jgi:hypothetical protein